MSDSSSPTDVPLDADDPRISEWIDGRLAAVEAAEIERAVQASPELASLVDDLRMIRGALRASVKDEPLGGFSDRVMAAIAAPQQDAHGSSAPRATPAVHVPGPHATPGRRFPWIAIASALAAGLLVAVVVNLPDDAGRDVALAPPAQVTVDGIDRSVARQKLKEATVEGRALGEGDGMETFFSQDSRREVAASTGRAGEEVLRERERGPVQDFGLKTSEKQDADAEAGLNAFAADGPSAEASQFRESQGRRSARFQALEDEALGGGGGGVPLPQSSAAPGYAGASPSVTRPPAPAPTTESRLIDALAPADKLAAPAEGEAADEVRAPESGASAKRVKSELAGVLVIAVDSPSERRALDQLVAASGLEVAAAKDRLELVGTATAVNGFLLELEKAGLLAGGRLSLGKPKADGPEQMSLVLRVVKRMERERQPAAEVGKDREQP